MYVCIYVFTFLQCVENIYGSCTRLNEQEVGKNIMWC